MAGGTELAVHYLLVAIGLTFFSLFAYGFAKNSQDVMALFKALALRVPPTIGNPLAYARVTLVVPLYTTLSLRTMKRFWINYGFKIVFMIGFSAYTWNVWSESLSDDPFTIIGVSTSATPQQVRKACRSGSRDLHPDKNPGREEEIRPLFEKHTRACKVLNDAKLREKYVKWGTLPRSDKDTGGAEGGDASFTGSSLLSVGGGGFVVSTSFFFLVFVGLPSIIAYYCVDFLYDDEAQLAKIVADCTSLNSDMNNLYTYGHFNSMFLDIAELYLLVAQAEFAEAKNIATTLNPRGAKSLDSLLNHHMARFSMWKDGNSIKKEEQANYDAKCAKVDAAIKASGESIANIAKRAKGSGKMK